MEKILALLPFVIVMQGCNSASAENSNSESYFELIHSKTYNDYAEQASKQVKILQTQDAYITELANKTSDDPESIDMDNSTVLFIDMGTFSSGGYDINVSYSTQTADYIKLNVEYNYPGDNCGVASVETNPYQFLKVNSTKFIIINETYTAGSC